MPTQLQHPRHAGRGPCSTRLLTLGLTLTAALSLSACGPAHKGQLKVEPADASAEAGRAFQDADPNAVGSTFLNDLDGPECHDLQ